MFCIFYRPPQLVDLFFWGSTSNHAVALSNSANGRQLPFHAPCMPQPKLSQCSANVQRMLSQCPANVQPICSANAHAAYAQPMLSQCSANAKPMLICLSCSAYALSQCSPRCPANASANAQQANAQPMPKGASMLKRVVF